MLPHTYPHTIQTEYPSKTVGVSTIISPVKVLAPGFKLGSDQEVRTNCIASHSLPMNATLGRCRSQACCVPGDCSVFNLKPKWSAGGWTLHCVQASSPADAGSAEDTAEISVVVEPPRETAIVSGPVWSHHSDGSVVLTLPGLGSATIHGGNRVIITPAPSSMEIHVASTGISPTGRPEAEAAPGSVTTAIVPVERPVRRSLRYFRVLPKSGRYQEYDATQFLTHQST